MITVPFIGRVLLAVAALGGLWGAPAAWSQAMLSPVAIAATDLTTYNDSVSMTNMINQSGVTTPFTSGVTSFDTYFANPWQAFATSGNGGTNNWQSQTAFDLGYQGYIEFDLGAVYRVHALAIWNRSLSNVTVRVRPDLAGPDQVAGEFNLIDRQSYPFSYAVDLLRFPATCEGRYVRLVVNGIHRIQGFNFGYSAAGEVVASVSPLGAAPLLSVTLDPNGDARVNFTGTLQAAVAADGTFTNVPGNPSSPWVLPKASLLPAQFFRARGD
jgi:hypothetical protein